MAFPDDDTRHRPFLVADEGATSIEYGLIVALMTVVLVTGLNLLGGSSGGMWHKVQTQVGNALK